MLKLKSKAKQSLLIGSLRTNVIPNIYRLHVYKRFFSSFVSCDPKTFKADVHKNIFTEHEFRDPQDLFQKLLTFGNGTSNVIHFVTFYCWRSPIRTARCGEKRGTVDATSP